MSTIHTERFLENSEKWAEEDITFKTDNDKNHTERFLENRVKWMKIK